MYLNDPRYKKLASLLRELGLSVNATGTGEASGGFPVLLPVPDGTEILIELPEPALLSNLDPNEVGVAILDRLGFVANSWGLAKDCPLISKSSSCLDGELRLLILSALEGTSGSLYADGFRFYAASYSGPKSKMIFLLVMNAYDEQSARKLAQKSKRHAEVLKRIGKVLTMSHALRPLCVAAVHEIAAILELAAVLLWVRSGSGNEMRLAAAVGVNSEGLAELQVISIGRMPTCLAELVAFSNRGVTFDSVLNCDYTIELEAKCCYLSAGGVSAIPLTVGDEITGVLELISRKDDSVLRDESETFVTIAEHLALALNNAMMYENVERLATYDPLTGIANHRSMQDFLMRRVAECQRLKSNIGVLMIDVDHFRSFNEEEGHDAGDAVLKKVVGAMSECVRQYDLAARYGGEEFTVVMPGASQSVVLRVAERIRAKVEAMGYVTRSGRARTLTVSIGAAIFPESAETPSGLLKAADLALFEAKRAGRNQVIWYQGKLGSERKKDVFDIQAVQSWIGDEEIERVSSLRSNLEPYVDYICAELALTAAQKSMLNGLIVIAPTYLRAKANNEVLLLRSLESASELRSLIPSLEALGERWDGTGHTRLSGDRIPLLGRVLAVMLVLGGELPSEYLESEGTLDPEIVAMISEIDEAA